MNEFTHHNLFYHIYYYCMYASKDSFKSEKKTKYKRLFFSTVNFQQIRLHTSSVGEVYKVKYSLKSRNIPGVC